MPERLVTPGASAFGQARKGGRQFRTYRGIAQVTLLEDNFKNFRGKIIDVGL